MKIEPAEKVSKLKLIENNFERIKSAVLSEKTLSQIYVELNFKSEMSEEEFVALSTMVYHKNKSASESQKIKKYGSTSFWGLSLIIFIVVLLYENNFDILNTNALFSAIPFLMVWSVSVLITWLIWRLFPSKIIQLSLIVFIFSYCYYFVPKSMSERYGPTQTLK